MGNQTQFLLMNSKKIKILFTLLAFGATLSVFSLTDYFHQGRASIFQNLAGNLSFKVDTDPDKDGLSNIDETYWGTDFQNPDSDEDGFLDGEEVASGHDPMVPGPNDLIADRNLTKRLSDLAAAGLVEGSLKPGSKNYNQSLNDLTSSILDETMLSLTPKVDVSRIIIVDSTKESRELYAKEIQTILEQFFKTLREQTDGLKGASAGAFIAKDANSEPDPIFLSASTNFKRLYGQAILISVPKNWKDNHLSLLNILDQLAQTNQVIAFRARDPIKGAAALNLWAKSYDGITSLLKTFADQLIQDGLINDQKK